MRYCYNVIVSPDHSNSTEPDGQALRTSDRGNVVVLVLTEQNRFPRFTFFADDGVGWLAVRGCCQNNFFPVLRQLAGPTPPTLASHWRRALCSTNEKTVPALHLGKCRNCWLDGAEDLDEKGTISFSACRCSPARAVAGGRKEGRKEGLTMTD